MAFSVQSGHWIDARGWVVFLGRGWFDEQHREEEKEAEGWNTQTDYCPAITGPDVR
jgi:hypothetical protein